MLQVKSVNIFPYTLQQCLYHIFVGWCLSCVCLCNLCQFVLIASFENFLDCRIGKFFVKSHHTKIVVNQFILEKKYTLQTSIRILTQVM